jgi:MoaA/NifB/PqqE/SkfB family radical SAM enzyme
MTKIDIKGDIKTFESPELNYSFNLKNGYTEVWGKTKEEDPPFSPYGSLIADIEITTKCSGIGGNGTLCPYCYKSNLHDGQNMSFETFKEIIQKINVHEQLQQVAFGLGSTAEENPDLWPMCDWLRAQNIIPNGTVADVSEETVKKIASKFGAVAISYHNDWDTLRNSLKLLVMAKEHLNNATLQQINIHFVLMEESYEDCLELMKKMKTEEFFDKVNAVVLLGLKKCGRAEKGNFNRISDDKFKTIIGTAMGQNIGLGFDSCSANRVAEVFGFHFDNLSKRFKSPVQQAWINSERKKLFQLIEPCESKLFSIYINTEGKVYPCSFNEKNREGFEILKCNDFLKEYWNNDADGWRESLIKSGRSCPVYEV